MEYKDITELRKIAKDAGIERSYIKGEQRLLIELNNLQTTDNFDEPILEMGPEKEPEVESVKEEIISASIKESESLQKDGWYVFAIIVKDRKTIHKLKRVSQS